MNFLNSFGLHFLLSWWYWLQKHQWKSNSKAHNAYIKLFSIQNHCAWILKLLTVVKGAIIQLGHYSVLAGQLPCQIFWQKCMTYSLFIWRKNRWQSFLYISYYFILFNPISPGVWVLVIPGGGALNCCLTLKLCVCFRKHKSTSHEKKIV